MFFNQEKSVFSVSLLERAGLEVVFMGNKDPRRKGSNMQIQAGNLVGQERSCYGRQEQKQQWQQSLPDTTQLLQVWPRQKVLMWTTVEMEIYI